MAHLLLFPAELREQIYIYAVVSPEVLDIIHPTIASSSRPSSAVSQPHLAKVSRQLRDEVLPIFYFQNTFQLRCALTFKARTALHNVSPRHSPGWLLRETANEVQLMQIMQYSFNVMQNLETCRSWLRYIGREKWKWLRGVVICGEGDLVQELTTLRFDYKFLQVTESGKTVLEEGWRWEGETEVQKECRKLGEGAPPRTHYLVRYGG